MIEIINLSNYVCRERLDTKFPIKKSHSHRSFKPYKKGKLNQKLIQRNNEFGLRLRQGDFDCSPLNQLMMMKDNHLKVQSTCIPKNTNIEIN